MCYSGSFSFYQHISCVSIMRLHPLEAAFEDITLQRFDWAFPTNASIPKQWRMPRVDPSWLNLSQDSLCICDKANDLAIWVTEQQDVQWHKVANDATERAKQAGDANMNSIVAQIVLFWFSLHGRLRRPLNWVTAMLSGKTYGLWNYLNFPLSFFILYVHKNR